MKSLIVPSVVVALLAVSPGLIAGDDSTKVTGEVVKVEQMTRTRNAGEFTAITIRTRNQEQVMLQIGPADSCPGCVRVGDQVRVRTMAGEQQGEMRRVRSMRVRREGYTYKYGFSDGRLVRSRDRSRAGNGDPADGQDRARDRSRSHEPGGGKGTRGGGSPRGGR